MGLDTSHGAWHSSYSYFNEWRKEIAKLSGFGNLDDYYGFGGEKRWENAAPNADRRLVPLLDHSDCDGEISPVDCANIFVALMELAPNLPRDGVYDWLYRATIQFADGCQRAAAANEPLDFH